MKRLIIICAVVGCVLAATGLATAADPCDPYPPEWRGQPRTLTAVWDDWSNFPGVYPAEPTLPNSWDSNPELEGEPGAYAYSSILWTYDPPYEGRNNVVQVGGNYQGEPYSGSIGFCIPNFPTENEDSYKNIRIQITYHPLNEYQYPWFNVYVNGGYSTEWGSAFVDDIDWGDGWVTEAYDITIWPNPYDEAIFLNFSSGYYTNDNGNGYPDAYPAFVDQVLIDTRCVPEPTTITLLGLGALSLLRRKRSV